MHISFTEHTSCEMQSCSTLDETSSPAPPTPTNDCTDDANTEVFAIPMEIETTITLEPCEHLPSNNLMCEPAQIISVSETINESPHQPILSEKEEVKEQFSDSDNLSIEHPQVLSEHQASDEASRNMEDVVSQQQENCLQEEEEEEEKAEEQCLVSVVENLQNVSSEFPPCLDKNKIATSETSENMTSNEEKQIIKQESADVDNNIENDAIGKYY